MKLVLEEPHFESLRAYVKQEGPGISCALARAEVVRVVRDQGADAIARAREAVGQVELVALDNDLLDAAAELAAPVRTLDAIHLAAAVAMGDELSALVTYDARMRRAAEELGMTVVSPGSG